MAKNKHKNKSAVSDNQPLKKIKIMVPANQAEDIKKSAAESFKSSPDGTVKMRFSEDKTYNGELIYEKDVIYDVPLNMSDRWLKRGGVKVSEDEAEMEAAMEKEIEKTGDMPDDLALGQEEGKQDGEDLEEEQESGDDSL